MWTKLIFGVLAVAVCMQAVAVEKLEEKENEWKIELRQELRQAQDQAAERLQLNLIQVLNGLSQTAATRGANVTNAIAILTRAVVTNTFDLAGVVAYMPRLLAQDLPTQFVEVLRLIRQNDVQLPRNVTGAIDTVSDLARQSQSSGIQDNLFLPITRFLPNLMAGVQSFLQTILGNVFGFLGVVNANRQ